MSRCIKPVFFHVFFFVFLLNSAFSAKVPGHLIEGGTTQEEKKPSPSRDKKDTSPAPSQPPKSAPRSDVNSQVNKEQSTNAIKDAESSRRAESRKPVGEVKGDGFRMTFFPVTSSFGEGDPLRIPFLLHNDSSRDLYFVFGIDYPRLIDQSGIERWGPANEAGIKTIVDTLEQIVKSGKFEQEATAVPPGGTQQCVYLMRTFSTSFPRTGSLPDFNFTGNLVVFDGNRFRVTRFTSPTLPLFLFK